MSTTQPGLREDLPEKMTLNRVLGDKQGLGEKSGSIIQVEGPSCVEVDCEGSEGERSKEIRGWKKRQGIDQGEF